MNDGSLTSRHRFVTTRINDWAECAFTEPS